MDEAEAREVLTKAQLSVDWLNLPRVLQTLGELGLDWKKFDNSYFRPDYSKVWLDIQYLADNMDNIKQAMQLLKEKKNV